MHVHMGLVWIIAKMLLIRCSNHEHIREKSIDHMIDRIVSWAGGKVSIVVTQLSLQSSAKRE